MALATQCPHCGTRFRVASDQLKLRGGIVRCGACQEIFDGSATLVDLDALPAKAPVPETPAPAAETPAPETPAEPEAPADVAPAAEPVPDPAVEPVPETVPEPVPEPVTESLTETLSEPAPVMEAAAEPAVADIAAATAPEADPAPAPLATMEDAATATPNFDDQPVYTLDFTHTFDPFGILPKVATDEADDADKTPAHAAEPEHTPANDVVQELTPPPFAPPTEIAFPPSGRIEPSFGLPVDEELVATALPGHEHEHDDRHAPTLKSDTAPVRAADAPPILPLREAAGAVIHAHAPAPSAPPVAPSPAARRAEKAAARRSRLKPTNIDAPPKIRVPESDEPEFVKRSRQQEQSGRTRKIAMLAGSLLLLLILVAQGAITFRNALAARFPGAKPALVSSCALFGCRVELPAQVDNLVIDTGELTTLGGGAYAFTTQLRNQGGVAQAWPSLELSLTDANDKPLVRRVFAPRDYLAANLPAANGLAPRVEQAITLHFRVDDLQPSGYHIAVFYP